MRILVLGAYGLIGLEVVRALVARGHEVIALGRSQVQRGRLPAEVNWVQADMSRMQQSEMWKPILDGVGAIVNAAGALQDGSRDDLEAVHHLSIVALLQACREEGVRRLVQISAPGATADSATEFLRSKSRGDEAVRCSAIEWVILRPGLVLAPNAYGGSALLRMAAGVPWIEGAVLPDAQIQTVSIDDVCECICEAVDGRVESGSEIEVLETQIHTLAEVTRAFRQWLGFASPYLRISVPRQLAYAAAWLADGLALLGWRSPLRTIALQSLEAGVTGDSAKATAVLGRNPRSMAQTLASMPSTLQDRWFARLYLLLPVMVATLAAFWIASGFVGLIRLAEAAAVISPAWVSAPVAGVTVVGFSALDITLGLAVLFRSSARMACGAMIVVSLLYVIGATIVAPALWLDPLGPLVKVIPAMVLALVTMAVLEER